MDIDALPSQIGRYQPAGELQADALGKIDDQPLVDVVNLHIEAMRDKRLTQPEQHIYFRFRFPILGFGLETDNSQQQVEAEKESARALLQLPAPAGSFV